MSIIGGQPSTMGDTRFADLKKSKKSMKASEEKQQDNTGVYTKELTVVEVLKSWKALMLALEKSSASTTPKTKELQSKT
tara:strand:+ start:403 stop:639 length:237 start_codon:yes stop_codon:yes gene_type:complete